VYTSYSPEEIDAVGAYSPDLNRTFLVPVADISGMRAIRLRLAAPRNN